MKISSLLLSAWLLTLSNAGYAYQYSITEIGLTSLARQALNNQGQIAGYSGSGDNRIPAYWNNGQLHQLGFFSDIAAINNHGDILGHVVINQEDNHPTIAVWSNGSLTTLNAVDGKGGYAMGLNDHGQIIGISEKLSEGGAFVATLWSNGTPTELAQFPTDQLYGVMQDINNAGQVIGNSRFGGHPLLWQNGSYTMLDGLHSVNAINNLGVVVGSSSSTAAMWVEGQSILLPASSLPNSLALDINDQGKIVGHSYYIDMQSMSNPVLHNVAALWADNQFFDLNALIDPASGWSLKSAIDINESGQILGWGVSNNRSAIFLLTPIPEPSTYGLLLAGLGLVTCVARSRKR